MTPAQEPKDRGRAEDDRPEEAAEGRAVSNGDLEDIVGGLVPSQIGPSSDITSTTQFWGDPI